MVPNKKCLCSTSNVEEINTYFVKERRLAKRKPARRTTLRGGDEGGGEKQGTGGGVSREQSWISRQSEGERVAFGRGIVGGATGEGKLSNRVYFIEN